MKRIIIELQNVDLVNGKIFNIINRVVKNEKEGNELLQSYIGKIKKYKYSNCKI